MPNSSPLDGRNLRALDEVAPRPGCPAPIVRATELDGIRIGYLESPAGEGRPIVLVHPIHPAAGAHDVRPLFDYLAASNKRVYALDLPGFGRSDRSERWYDDAHYARALELFLREVMRSDEAGGASVVAMSLSCEIAARVAVEAPGLIGALVLLSPTGLSDRRRASRGMARLRHAMLAPVARPLFALLTSRVGIRFRTARSLSVPVPEQLMEEQQRVVRAPGAVHAPLAMIAGVPLHPRPFEELYRCVPQPTTVVYDRDPSTTFERLAELARANPRVLPVHLPPSGGLSTYEHPATLAALIIQQQLDLGGGRPPIGGLRSRQVRAA